MSDRRSRRHGPLIAVVAIGAAVAGFAVSLAPAPTEAAWVVPKTLQVVATAVTPAPPTALTCGAASGALFSSIPFTWTAPPGTAPSGYTLKWTGGGSASFATTSGSVPSSAMALGSFTVSVHADYGTSWQSAAGTQTRAVSTIAFGTLWGCT